jgi:hypothetical protein
MRWGIIDLRQIFGCDRKALLSMRISPGLNK